MKAFLAHQVDLHILNLEDPIYSHYACQKILNSEETQRMQRFATIKLQEKFALTRGSLRFILAEYLGMAPESIAFQYGKFGKPYLKNHPLYFNLAHSGEYAALALTKANLIGVDIEKSELTHKPHLDIAKRFFTTVEYTAIQNASDPETLFFHIWTQKEAFLKAIGQGITAGLDQFEVATCLQDSYIKNIKLSEYKNLQWASRSFDSLTGYRLTVTKEGTIGELKLSLPTQK